jgi:hypothetical protein
MLPYEVFIVYLKWFLTCSKILRHGVDGFTSPPKEGVLQNFIVFKSSLPSAGSEPAILWSNGRYANHYANEDDCSGR